MFLSLSIGKSLLKCDLKKGREKALSCCWIKSFFLFYFRSVSSKRHWTLCKQQSGFFFPDETRSWRPCKVQIPFFLLTFDKYTQPNTLYKIIYIKKRIDLKNTKLGKKKKGLMDWRLKLLSYPPYMHTWLNADCIREEFEWGEREKKSRSAVKWSAAVDPLLKQRNLIV